MSAQPRNGVGFRPPQGCRCRQVLKGEAPLYLIVPKKENQEYKHSQLNHAKNRCQWIGCLVGREICSSIRNNVRPRIKSNTFEITITTATATAMAMATKHNSYSPPPAASCRPRPQNPVPAGCNPVVNSDRPCRDQK